MSNTTPYLNDYDDARRRDELLAAICNAITLGMMHMMKLESDELTAGFKDAINGLEDLRDDLASERLSFLIEEERQRLHGEPSSDVFGLNNFDLQHTHPGAR